MLDGRHCIFTFDMLIWRPPRPPRPILPRPLGEPRPYARPRPSLCDPRPVRRRAPLPRVEREPLPLSELICESFLLYTLTGLRMP